LADFASLKNWDTHELKNFASGLFQRKRLLMDPLNKGKQRLDEVTFSSFSLQSFRARGVAN